jgi:hypothetical protein
VISSARYLANQEIQGLNKDPGQHSHCPQKYSRSLSLSTRIPGKMDNSTKKNQNHIIQNLQKFDIKSLDFNLYSSQGDKYGNQYLRHQQHYEEFGKLFLEQIEN